MKKKPAPRTEDELAEIWKKRYDLAASQQEARFKKIAAYYDILYTVVSNEQKMAPWRSKVVFPTLGAKARDLIAKIVMTTPAVSPIVKAGAEEDQELSREKAEKIGHKLEADYTNPLLDSPMGEKLEDCLWDTVVGGLGVGKTPYVTRKRCRRERITDPETGMATEYERYIESQVGYNDLIPVTAFNFFHEPAAPSFYGAKWHIIREFKSLEELQAVNEDHGAEFYRNLKRLKGEASVGDPHAQYKASRDRVVGADALKADTTINHFPIYECYELSTKKLYTFAEHGEGNKRGWLLIRNQTNPYWHEKYPLVPFYVQRRPHNVWGVGLFETNHRLDAAKNSLFNHYLDAYSMAVDPGIIVEEESVVDDYVIEPGFELRYKRGGAKPEPFKMAAPDPAQIQIVLQMLEKELESNSISSYASGNPNSATDKTQGTATGIARLQDAAGDTISFFRRNYKQSLITLFSMWHSNNQQFMGAPETVMINDKDGRKPVQVSPEDIQGDVEITIDDESLQPMNKLDKRAQFNEVTDRMLVLQKASMEQANAFGGDPIMYDFRGMAAETAEQYGNQALSRYILTEEQVAEVKAQQQQQAAEMEAKAREAEMAQQAAMSGQKDTLKADDELNRMRAELAASGMEVGEE